jgi:hypothetical protein
MFFVIHPVNFLCSENCLISALLFSTIFSFLNINIYRYVKGDEFDILSGYAYTIKPNTDPLIRFLWFRVKKQQIPILKKIPSFWFDPTGAPSYEYPTGAPSYEYPIGAPQC